MSIQSNQPVHSCSRFRTLWMKKASSIGLISLGLVSLMSLGGCANQQTRTNQVAASDAQTSAYVDQQMEILANSVDKSLKDLQRLDRGDEGPRKNTPMGMAVGGAAGPNLAPVSMPMQAGADTALGQQQAQEQLARNRAMLDTHVKLNWEGGATDFLRSLASKVGFHFAVVGNGPDPHIHIHVSDSTIQSVLTIVADQITQTADIHVDVASRCISLVYH